MGACTIPGCHGETVAKGLCRMHYMRLRRRGETAPPPLKPGRKAKPHPEVEALKRENAALREQVAALTRKRKTKERA